MARKYYTLLSKGNEPHHNGVWCVEFGSFDRADVVSEMEEGKERAAREQERISWKIITTGPMQADINAKVAELNA